MYLPRHVYDAHALVYAGGFAVKWYICSGCDAADAWHPRPDVAGTSNRHADRKLQSRGTYTSARTARMRACVHRASVCLSVCLSMIRAPPNSRESS